MKNIFLFISVVFAILVSCGTPNDNNREHNQEQKVKINKLNVEIYCDVSNEIRALLMEKYWDQFKGKSYDEVKDIYAQYLKDEDAIFTKYDLENNQDLSNYFRKYFREIEAYQATNPAYKDYKEYDKAKRKLMEFASKSH